MAKIWRQFRPKRQFWGFWGSKWISHFWLKRTALTSRPQNHFWMFTLRSLRPLDVHLKIDICTYRPSYGYQTPLVPPPWMALPRRRGAWSKRRRTCETSYTRCEFPLILQVVSSGVCVCFLLWQCQSGISPRVLESAVRSSHQLGVREYQLRE